MSNTNLTELQQKVLSPHALDSIAHATQGALELVRSGAVQRKDAKMAALAPQPFSPQPIIYEETPDNRLIVSLKAMGKSHDEICNTLAISLDKLNGVLLQPWAKTRLLELYKQAGAAPYEALLESSTLDSLLTIIEIRDSVKTPVNLRLKAAIEVLDRGKGKAKIYVEQKRMGEDRDIGDLDAKIAAERASQQDLIGRKPVRDVNAVVIRTS